MRAVTHAPGVLESPKKPASKNVVYGRGVDCRVLGPVEVLSEGSACALGGPKQRAVIAVLAAAAGRPVSVDALLQAIYGEDASPSSRATLHTYVSNLRNVLGDVIVRRSDAYLLDCSDATIDAVEFEDAYNTALRLGSAADMASHLREALSMWRGHPFADVDAHGHLDGQITRLNELRLAALESRLDADLRAGRHREVVAELDALTVEYPFRENLRAMHMLALYRSGRQGDALRACASTRAFLVEELGIDPSPELQELEQRILRQDRQLLLDVAPTVQQRAVVVADIEDSGWSSPAQREAAFARRDSALAVTLDEPDGIPLAPMGTAAYAVFIDPIRAVRAARAAVAERTRVAVDFGDLQIDDNEPLGPPLTRAARLVAVAHPGQALMSPAAHDALTAAGAPGWAAEALGRFDIAGLDPGMQIFQLVGDGFAAGFPELVLDRLPPPLPSGAERAIPGYELRALLGIGELGEVHRAYQATVGREVAVRVFGPGMVGHPQFLRRFETAAQRITRVEHPGLVPFLDYWREPTRAVLVTRLLTGGTLRDRTPEGGMDSATALHIFETIASAVASAHRHGIVHGRLRPHNVLFDGEDNAYVADLGVDEMCTGVTGFGASAYDAPERLGGALATPASDIYSLGVLIHELLGGSPPPVDAALPKLDSPADTVVARATDGDPNRRYGSVEELAADLRDTLVGRTDTPAVFVPTRNPYRGLAPFEQADVADFFGRDRATAEMVAILDEQPLLLVVGPSGIGKSSAVKAGLLPALSGGALAWSDSWLVTEMVPGRSPFGQLAVALARIATGPVPDVIGDLTSAKRSLEDIVTRIAPSTVVVLVVDQFEELFTETVDDRERRAFLRMLVDVANGRMGAVRIIATMRADFFDRPLAYPGFADAIKDRTVVLGAMTEPELADAVSCPAAGVGIEVDPALVDRLTADAVSQPGSLPLLQYVMADLFVRRTSNTITLAAYLESGGLAGAIGRRAETIFQALDRTQQDTAQQLFLRLVNVSDGGDDTRRRARLTELEQAGIAGDPLDVVLDEFGRERLLTFDRDPSSRTPTVEVAHEALLTDWDRLNNWIDAARDDLLTRRRLESATNEWIHADCDGSFLIGGGRLEVTETWAAESRFALTHDEQRFLQESRARFDRDLRSRARRRRVAVGALMIGLVATAALAALALRQRDRADASRTLAEARRLGTQAQLVDNYDQALLLAVEGRHLDDTPETQKNLLTTIQRFPQATAVLRPGAEKFFDIGFAQDSQSLLATGPAGLYKYDIASSQLVSTVPVRSYGTAGAVSPDGTRAVIALDLGDSLPLDIIDTARLEIGGPTMSSPDSNTVSRVVVSPDGRYVAGVTDNTLTGSGLVPAIAFVWDVSKGGDPILRHGFEAEYRERDVAFSPDSKQLLVAGGEGTAVLDIASGATLSQIGGAYPPIAVSPDGRTLAATTDRGRAVIIGLFDVTSGRRGGAPLAGHADRIVRMAFSANGTALASGGDDNLVMVWNVTTGDGRPLRGHAARVNALAFTGDGTTLWSGGDDGAIFAWDLQRATTLVHRASTSAEGSQLPFESTDMVIAPDGAHVAFPSSDDLHVAIRDVEGGGLIELPPARFDAEDRLLVDLFLSFSPDGQKFLTVSSSPDKAGGMLRVRDVNTGEVLADSQSSGMVFAKYPRGPMAVFTPDGRRVVAIQVDTIDPENVDPGDTENVVESIVVLDADTLAPDGGEPVPIGDFGRAIGVTPDGTQAVVVVSDIQPNTDVVLIDLTTRSVVRSTSVELLGEPFPGSRNNSFAADGRTVGLGNNRGDIGVVDAVSGKVTTLPLVHNVVESEAFAPDGATFITTGQDGAVYLWDAETQHRLGSMTPLGPIRVRARYLADDQVMLVYGTGEILEWDPRPDAWEAYACKVAGRNLGQAEWAELFPGQAYRVTCPQYPAGE